VSVSYADTIVETKRRESNQRECMVTLTGSEEDNAIRQIHDFPALSLILLW
jgi:hypothetical protein